MKNSITFFVVIISLLSIVSCKEISEEKQQGEVFVSWQTETGLDLLMMDSRYEPFQVRFNAIGFDNGDEGLAFDTLLNNSRIYLMTNGQFPLYSQVDFGNGDVDTLEMRGDGGNSPKAFYSLSTKFDFYFNGELQVSWDIEAGTATYHYDGGRKESIPKRENIFDDTRFNYLLLKKDSASMADIGFE